MMLATMAASPQVYLDTALAALGGDGTAAIKLLGRDPGKHHRDEYRTEVAL